MAPAGEDAPDPAASDVDREDQPPAPTDRAEGPPAPIEPDRRDVGSAVVMGVLFVGTILLSMVIARVLTGRVQPVFEDPQDPTNSLLYLGLVVVFTAAILLIAKLGLQKVIQYVILGAVFLTMAYVYEPLLALALPTSGSLTLWLSVGLAAALTGLLYYYPEWYVVDAAGISVAAGATGLFGFSFGLLPAILLLVAFAVYDAIAVYRTKHMLDLADQVMGLRLPIMLVVPKVRDYSFLEGDELEDEEGEGRDALFMGLGDIVIPGVLVVSAMTFLGAPASGVDAVLGLAPATFVAITTLVGATIGFGFLMRGVLKGTPHAGLPALNGGALLGFLIPVLWLYGTAPLIPSL